MGADWNRVLINLYLSELLTTMSCTCILVNKLFALENDQIVESCYFKTSKGATLYQI